MLAFLGSGAAQDARRLRWLAWKDDWGAARGKLRILAASTYICLASAIPALAFGVQASADTDGLLSPVSVLAATAITGVTQALVGGQPLLIVGVAEPIVLTWGYMYTFAKDREGLGRERFLAWAAWCCVWAAAMIIVLALTNACVYIRHFTRLSGELFGALIALLFMQQAIKGCVEEFRNSSDGASGVVSGGSGGGSGGSGGGSGGSADPATWQLVNGLWSLLLALGLLLSSLLLRTARSWRFLRSPVRGFLADYGAPLMLLAFTGLSFAVRGGSSSGAAVQVPSRVETPDVWDASANHWTVAAGMGQLEGRWIAAALIPAALITVLFFFDHNVSAQMAQQEEFNLKKPPAYHWDFLLLGLMTLLCGLLGLPPVNGVLPQAPMHTKALAKVSSKRRSSGGRSPQQQGARGQQQQQQEEEGTGHGPGSGKASPFVPSRPPAAGCVELGAAGCGKGLAIGESSEVAAAGGRGKSLHLSPSAQALLPHASGGSSSNLAAPVNGSSSSSRSAWLAVADGDLAAAPLVAAGEVLQPAGGRAAGGGSAALGGASGAAGAAGTAASSSGPAGPVGGPAGPAGAADSSAGAADEIVAVHVYEQRWSGLLQSLGVAAFLAATPAIRQIPTACLWGYFAFMALESLLGSQFWDRLLLMLTDPARRAGLLEQEHVPYLETVPFRVIAWFTAFQTAYLLLVYGITWAGVAGILFPLPIMALVPLRQWVLPRCFANPRHLQELDAAKEEEAAPLSHQQALQEAAAQGLATGSSGPGGGRGSEESEGGLPESELHRLRVVHHLSRGSLLHRRSAMQAAADTAAAAAAGAAAGTAAAAAGVSPPPTGAAAAAAGAAAAAAVAHAAEEMPLPGTAWSPRAAANLRRRSLDLPHV